MTGWRTELTVRRLDRRLRGAVPRSARRAIRRDVRANLELASRELGEREAIRRFGDIEGAASEYRAGFAREREFQPERGAWAALFVTVLLLAVTFARIPTFNLVDTFDRHTGATTWSWEVWRLWRFEGDVSDGTLFEGTVYSYAYLVFALSAFVIWSRAWRLLRPLGDVPPRRRAEDSPD
jgi:hypothetical protein